MVGSTNLKMYTLNMKYIYLNQHKRAEMIMNKAKNNNLNKIKHITMTIWRKSSGRKV